MTAQDRRPPSDRRVGDVDPDEQATVTLYLRRRAALPPEGTRLSRAEFAARHGAADEDVDAVRSFATGASLGVAAVDAGRRMVQVTGRLADLAAAFGAELGRFQAPDGTVYRASTSAEQIPASLAGVVTGVFGLDQRPQARPRYRRPVVRASGRPAVVYTPPQVATAYRFPASADGSGKCVGLVELGGGYRASDLDTYFSGLGLPTPTVTAISVDGATNAPSTASSADVEVMLDIEVVGSTAPGATIVVYFAPNTDQGFLDAVTTAIHDTTNAPSVLSISWGSAESTWTSAAMTQMEDAFSDAAALGVTVAAAAGDDGSSDGVDDGEAHVDFPASAPHALGCGGTTLRLGSSDTIASEVVWNDTASGDGATGGGVSAVFPVPSYQASAGVPPSANPGGGTGRGVPDVAGDANPETGYEVTVDGTTEPVGGTSAVAPLWAALIARLDEALGDDVGFVHPRLYAVGLIAPATGAAFTDITSGNNGAYRAGPGWDACSGLGTPLGQALLEALAASAGS